MESTTKPTNGAGQTTDPATPAKPRGAIKWTLVFKTSGDDPKFFYTCPCCGVGQQVDPHMGSVRVRDEFLDEAIYTFGQDAVTLDFAQHVASGCAVKGMSVPGGIVMPERDSSEVVWLVLADVDKGWDVLRYNLHDLAKEVEHRRRAVAVHQAKLTEAQQAHDNWCKIFDVAEQVTIPD